MNERGILRKILPSNLAKEEDQQEDQREMMSQKDRDQEGDSQMIPKEGDDATALNSGDFKALLKCTPIQSCPPKKKVICGGCGGARFIPCTRCNGSTKSCVLRFPASSSQTSSASIAKHLNNEKSNEKVSFSKSTTTTRGKIVSLKCSLCSRGTGLIRCPLCFTSNSSSPLTNNSLVADFRQISGDIVIKASHSSSLSSSNILKRNLGNSIFRKPNLSSSLLSLNTSSSCSSSSSMMSSSGLPSPTSSSSSASGRE